MRYRFLEPHSIGNHYYDIDDVAEMSANWKPTGSVEPLDNEATEAFYAAGPQSLGLVRSSWA
jgi:hypothetical protein